MRAEHWIATFPALVGGERNVIVSILSTIIKTEHKDGMVAASKIAASYEIESEDADLICRTIAREILSTAVEA